MRYRDLLLEYRRDKTDEMYGDKLRQHFMQELANGAPNGDQLLHQMEEWAPGFTFKKGKRMNELVLDFFEALDPTKKKAYVPALARWYATDSMKRVEDALKAKPVILLAQKFANRLKGMNPLVMSFDEFLDLGDELSGSKSRSEVARDEEQVFYDNGSAKVFYDGPDMKIIIPKTEEAAQYFGRGTRWCTASREDNMFNYYNRQGPIYCILFKGENRRWQFHFESDQFMDERDRDLDTSTELFKTVIAHFQHEIENNLWPHLKDRATMPYSALKYLIDPPVELIMEILEAEGSCIEFVKEQDRTDEMWYTALKSDWHALRFDGRPKEDIGLFAIQQNCNAIKYLPRPTVKEQVLAVTIDPEVTYIINRDCAIPVCPEAALLAVKQSGRYILYCANPTPEVQIAAVKQDVSVLQYINEPTPEVCNWAVEQNGRNIIYIKDRKLWTDALKLKAVRNNPSVISLIPNPTQEMRRIADKARNVSLRSTRGHWDG